MLRLVVRSFIDTAGPVGSRFLSRRYGLNLSPASIRNTMSDLEEMGYLDHPYTSAGRVPTELGYRKFVDELMETTGLTPREKQLIRVELERMVRDTEDMFREGSRLLGRLSDLLGVILTPKLSTGVLDRLEVVPLSSTRAMFVISMRGGLVRTILVEIDSNLSREAMDRVVPLLNERLSGLTLEDVRETYKPRISDIDDLGSGIIRLILNEGANLFNEPAEGRRLRYGGAQNILRQPEFQETEDLRRIMELIEDEADIIQLLEDSRQEPAGNVGRAIITIGRENTAEKAEKCSIVSARYRLGDAVGAIGIVGPMRMDYGRVVALVESVAAILSGSAGEQQESETDQP